MRSMTISPLPAYLRMFLANSETAVAMLWQSGREKPISSAKREAAINERVASDSELIRSRNLDRALKRTYRIDSQGLEKAFFEELR